MNSDEGSSRIPSDDLSDEEVHQGYDLETGLLARAREWIDLFPWLRLVRVLRVAGSPPLLVLTALVFAIWLIGQRVIFGQADPPEFSATTTDNVKSLMGYFRLLVPTSLFDPDRGGWRLVAMLVWSIIVWTPIGMLLARQGAC